MRVISGIARGPRLNTLEGDNTRPTSDRVKEAIFSIIQFDLQDAVVLDLFSGSGQLAIEAISRGAKKAFVNDSSLEAVRIIKSNVIKTHFTEQIQINNQEFISALQQAASDKYDIVFLDPPYNKNLCVLAIEEINKQKIYKNNTIIICETDRNELLPEIIGSFYLKKEYIYSKTKVTIYNTRQ